MNKLIVGLCLISMGLSGCIQKEAPRPSSFVAIGGIDFVLKENLPTITLEQYAKKQGAIVDGKPSPMMKLYGIIVDDLVAARMGLQQFFLKNPNPRIEHVATRLCDQIPLVILWSEKKENSAQEFLLTQGIAKVENHSAGNTSGQDFCETEKTNSLQGSSYSSLFHEFEKEAKRNEVGMWNTKTKKK